MAKPSKDFLKLNPTYGKKTQSPKESLAVRRALQSDEEILGLASAQGHDREETRRYIAKASSLEIQFLRSWCKVAANRLPSCRHPCWEYRFSPTRRWRFDFAWPDVGIYVELEGGTWSRGRHTRGTGFAGDCAKYNAATLAGWTGFRIPSGAVDIALVKDIHDFVADAYARSEAAIRNGGG